ALQRAASPQCTGISLATRVQAQNRFINSSVRRCPEVQGQIHYGPQEVHSLRFIRQARRLGFLVEDIRRLLALWHDRTRASSEVKAIALDHVAELDRRIAELTDMRDTLAHLANHCHGDDRPECPIIEGLADAGMVSAESGNACKGFSKADVNA
ncbi:MAG: Cu(I)-responsive transcriptional regulator, partial [uncultured Paraburkholderia sp.]